MFLSLVIFKCKLTANTSSMNFEGFGVSTETWAADDADEEDDESDGSCFNESDSENVVVLI